MKKILGSLTIIGLTLALATGLSRAFFSDTETSRDNTLTAGKIDLLIDNTSYYNGAPNGNTTWTPENLTNHLFFNFTDIKPGDWGEDTISLHVDDNDAWACMKISLTADDDNTCTDPEDDAGVDPSCNEPDGDLFDGELGKTLTFIFWADDGDNVLETNEVDKIFKVGTPKSLFTSNNWTISDSVFNIWQGAPSPLVGTQTYFIGKAWCFGALGLNPVATGQGQNPSVNSGITCNGTLNKNDTQTDILTADVEFIATQSRNNSAYVCDPNWLFEGTAKDPNAPQLGAIKYKGYPAGYEFWFTPNTGISFYIAGHKYHNFYEVNPAVVGDWCGTTVVPNRTPYNLTGHTGETVYWKVFDVTGGEPGVLVCS